MSVHIVLKATGQEIIFPTPTGNKQTKIDELPYGKLTRKEVRKYLKFHKKRNKTQRSV